MVGIHFNIDMADAWEHGSSHLAVQTYMRAILESVREAVNSLELAIDSIPEDSGTVQ